jgi:RNA chaperone Hfq
MIQNERRGEDNNKTRPAAIHPQAQRQEGTIRLVSGGQPVTGTIEGYNPYEILLKTAKGQLLVFKHAIATIETVDEPKGYSYDG